MLLFSLTQTNRGKPHCARWGENHRCPWSDADARWHRCAHSFPDARSGHDRRWWLLPGHQGGAGRRHHHDQWVAEHKAPAVCNRRFRNGLKLVSESFVWVKGSWVRCPWWVFPAVILHLLIGPNWTCLNENRKRARPAHEQAKIWTIHLVWALWAMRCWLLNILCQEVSKETDRLCSLFAIILYTLFM